MRCSLLIFFLALPWIACRAQIIERGNLTVPVESIDTLQWYEVIFIDGRKDKGQIQSIDSNILVLRKEKGHVREYPLRQIAVMDEFNYYAGSAVKTHFKRNMVHVRLGAMQSGLQYDRMISHSETGATYMGLGVGRLFHVHNLAIPGISFFTGDRTQTEWITTLNPEFSFISGPGASNIEFAAGAMVPISTSEFNVAIQPIFRLGYRNQRAGKLSYGLGVGYPAIIYLGFGGEF